MHGLWVRHKFLSQNMILLRNALYNPFMIKTNNTDAMHACVRLHKASVFEVKINPDDKTILK